MKRVEDLVEIDSPRWSVWSVLTDPSYLPKLYPDVITVEVEPPGKFKLGSRGKVLARLGKVKVEVFVEVTGFEEEASFVTRQLPGGLFKAFRQEARIEADGMRTKAKVSFDYELVPEYASTVVEEAFLDSRVADNLRWYTRNLKEICELLPVS